jgi:hypothetical protein
MRRDNQSTSLLLLITRMIRVSCRRLVDKAQLHGAFPTLHILQVMFYLFQVQDRFSRIDLDLRRKCGCTCPGILLCYKLVRPKDTRRSATYLQHNQPPLQTFSKSSHSVDRDLPVLSPPSVVGAYVVLTMLLPLGPAKSPATASTHAGNQSSAY